MFDSTNPSLPQCVQQVVRALQLIDGPLVFAAAVRKAEMEMGIFVLMDGEQYDEDDGNWEAEAYQPVTKLLEMNLDAELATTARTQGWGKLVLNVFFSPTLRPSLAMLGMAELDIPLENDPEGYLCMVVKIPVEQLPLALH